MQINILDKQNSIINNYLRDMRSVAIQGDSMRFRRNIERIGSLMGYEVSKTLDFTPTQVQTPLGTATVNTVSSKVVLGTILRAAMPMHNGLLDVFDDAENCFVTAFRRYNEAHELEVCLQYAATPSLEGKTLIICDPMLATGMSLAGTIDKLKKFGTPAHVHILSIIGSTEGVKCLQDKFPGDNTTLWVASVDPTLDANKYIVPGLGDAGDLAYGTKL